MYKNKEAIAIAGNTNPTNGTKIEGKKLAAIIKYLHRNKMSICQIILLIWFKRKYFVL